MVRHRILFLSILLATASPGLGQIIVPGADGSDGAFNPGAGNTVVDLANSLTAAWDAPNPAPGSPLTGVYDPNKFAVVFRYSSVNIPPGALVVYSGHSSANPPVVWLVSGDVTIAGTLHLNGNDGHPATAPGTAWGNVGGFRGGLGNQGVFTPQSAGYGPGGTKFVSTPGPIGAGAFGGSHGTTGFAGDGASGAGGGPTYGNAKIVPLIGGSGGAGYMRVAGFESQETGGGGGGGAVLIAATGTISITGSGVIRANGGNGIGGANYHGGSSGGSGGAIRLIANQINGPASSVTANGGSASNGSGVGGAGRIRFEYNSGTDIPFSSPPASHAIVGAAAQIWPSATHPTVRIVSIGGAACPADPRANMGLPADVSLSQPFPVPVIIEAANVPLDWNVRLRTVPIRGQDILSNATLVSGDATLSTWQAQVQLTNGFSIMQARASAP